MYAFRFSSTLLSLALVASLAGCDCDPQPVPSDSGVPGDGATPLDGAIAHGDGAIVGSDGAVTGSCGDGVIHAGEACDDGNTEDGDGCSADCSAVDPRFVCPAPGHACVRVVTCGNGRIEGDETCDDRNAVAGDGCSESCHVEDGWTCPSVGSACRAARCGDGVVAGFETCDDGNTTSGDGCSERCELEEGYVCREGGEACETTTCGDGVVEGTEECDDGNLQVGDGCTPFCTREPSCSGGDCVAVCGDEVVTAPEGCDDGNTLSGDGCSADCQIEVGWACEAVELPDPPSVTLPIVVRDFLSGCSNDGVTARPQRGASGATPPYGHPDFQCYNGAETGMVGTTLVDGVPTRRSTAVHLTSDESFALWYRSDDDYNRTVVQGMTLDLMSGGGGAYRFDSASFFPLSSPIDGSSPAGFTAEGLESRYTDTGGSGSQNFHFTSEVRFWFAYEGTETLAFSGDDDVWVFINGRLAVDIGGVHGRQDGQITLSQCASADPAANAPGCLAPLDLRVGGIYEAVVFQAERHTSRSQYRLTLTNFNRAPSICRSTCGDGVIASNEACDDGAENGAEYDGCSATCELTPYCGDGVVQEEFGEVCDDGLNLGIGASGCAPGCRELGARCGDGVAQTDRGEQCDDGNTDDGDGCSADCQIEIF